MAMGACIDNHRGCAERAFGGLGICIKFDLCRTIGALADAGFFHFRIAQRLGNPAPQVQLGDTAAFGPDRADRLYMAAMVTFQITAAGVIAQVGPAGITGKPVLLQNGGGIGVGQGAAFGLCEFIPTIRLGAQKFKRRLEKPVQCLGGHDPQRVIRSRTCRQM